MLTSQYCSFSKENSYWRTVMVPMTFFPVPNLLKYYVQDTTVSYYYNNILLYYACTNKKKCQNYSGDRLRFGYHKLMLDVGKKPRLPRNRLCTGITIGRLHERLHKYPHDLEPKHPPHLLDNGNGTGSFPAAKEASRRTISERTKQATHLGRRPRSGLEFREGPLAGIGRRNENR